ncbi:hypothetical protein JTB14_014175 [Gonioctena quinquepunctata]|nr:hypothetical protein JTB14_014175 [Gonioctena quinquepunctata]
MGNSQKGNDSSGFQAKGKVNPPLYPYVNSRIVVYTSPVKNRTVEEHRSMREQGKKEREHKKQHTELQSEEQTGEVGRFHPMMLPQYVNVAPEENTSGIGSKKVETDVHSENGGEQLLDEPATQ